MRKRDGTNYVNPLYGVYVQTMKHHNMHSVVSKNDARIEAHASRNRGDKSATIWVADVEVRTVDDTRTGILAFIDELRRLIVKKVSLNVGYICIFWHGKCVFIWIPRYGGKKSAYPCDM
ncbi:N-acetylmuramoyl-L-alanine amidase [Bacillus cereus BGSC 6E1]|nr:N-acetylmuramoyl-L-alanine amidase [Bacillus cereus BGSC 6E1]